MNREEKIKKIYEKVAMKELTLGCKVKYGDTEGVEHFYIGEGDFGGKLLWKETTIEGYSSCSIETEEGEEIEIMGHDVMLGDIWDYLEKINVDSSYIDGIDGDDCGHLYPSNHNSLFCIYENKRKPIEEQSDECVNFIYDLIKE